MSAALNYDAKIPDVQDELDRKAIETLEMLLLRRDQGKITEAQFDTGIDVLFSTVSGLVREDFAELISLSADDIDRNDPSFEQRRVFWSEGTFFYLKENIEKAKLMLAKHSGGEWKKFEKDYSDLPFPEKSLKKYVEAIEKNMTDKGFAEL